MEKLDEARFTLDLMDKLDNRYEPKHKTQVETKDKTKKKKRPIDVVDAIFIIFVIIVAGYVLLYSDIDELHDLQRFMGTREDIDTGVPINHNESAYLDIYEFNDLHSNISVNVEMFLRNTGNQTAEDIEIYVRAKNQNGTILYFDFVEPSIIELDENQTCSAIYSVPISSIDTTIHHTIELSWSSGREILTKTTTL